MIIKVSNKDIHRYRYTKRSMWLKRVSEERSDKSFGEIFNNIKDLKERGIISSLSVSVVTKAVKKN